MPSAWSWTGCGARVCPCGGLVQELHDGVLHAICGLLLLWGIYVLVESRACGGMMRVDITRLEAIQGDGVCVLRSLEAREREKRVKYEQHYPATDRTLGAAFDVFGGTGAGADEFLRRASAVGEHVTGRAQWELRRELTLTWAVAQLRHLTRIYEIAAWLNGVTATDAAWVPAMRQVPSFWSRRRVVGGRVRSRGYELFPGARAGP